jgi:hypothetical protein
MAENLGKRINNLQELNALCHEKKSVIVPGYRPWEKPTPAAFMLQQHGDTLLNYFARGMYEYIPASKLIKSTDTNGEYAIKGGEITPAPDYKKLFHQVKNVICMQEEEIQYFKTALSIAVKRICDLHGNNLCDYILNEIENDAAKRMNPNG